MTTQLMAWLAFSGKLEPDVNQIAMSKSEIFAEIQTLASARLSGPGPWLAQGEACAPLYRKIQELGLWEPLPGEPRAWRATALGTELHFDLLCVFLGFWDKFEAAEILADHGFIDNHKVHQLCDLMDAGNDPEEVLKPVVRAAYRRYLERSPFMS